MSASYVPVSKLLLLHFNAACIPIGDLLLPFSWYVANGS